MAAVIDIRTGGTVEGPTRDARADRGPRLRVLEGGRSRVALRQRQVYRRRRILAGACVLLVLWGGVSIAGAAFAAIGGVVGSVVPTGTEPATSSYVVQQGDTLWSIASSAGLGGDRRDTVRSLVEMNRHQPGLDEGRIAPGQTLLVPTAPG